MMATDRLYIPVQDSSNEVVELPINHLPDAPDDLIQVLMMECVPLTTWLDFAKAYLSRGRVANFLYILNEAINPETLTEAGAHFNKKMTYEEILFNCCLAAYYVTLSKDERDKGKKADLTSKAQVHLMKAKELDQKEQLPYIGMGLLNLAKGDKEAAKREFRSATTRKNNGRANILGHLALASLHFEQGDYKEALRLYGKALRAHPGCPAEVRLGLAGCHFRLGDLRRAQLAYERVLELQPDSIDALLGLAVVRMNASNVQQGLADGIKHLVRAYVLDASHVGVLAMLAHMCLLRGEHDKVLHLAKAALEGADNEGVRAACLTSLARAHHALGNFKEAGGYYMQASRLEAGLPLPHLGLAQMYIGQQEFRNAASELEAVLQAAPSCYDALKVLGNLYPQLPGKVEGTIRHFHEAAENHPDDVEVWEMLGELLSPTDPAGSLEAYQKALALHRSKQDAVRAKRRRYEYRQARRQAAANGGAENGAAEASSEEEEEDGEEEVGEGGPPAEYYLPGKLLNNAAVLLYRAGRGAEALALMTEATEVMMSAVDSGGVAPMQKITLGYNRARLQEATGDLNSAVQGYKDILDQFPGYIDCYLRLACVSRASGDIKAALEWAQKALEREGGHADARSLLGQLHMERRDWKEAKEVLTQLVKDPASAGDTYGRLALANLHLYTAPMDWRRPDQIEKANAHFRTALDLYRRVLDNEPRNIYAANGIGAILAEQGQLEAAREVFMAVQESAAASGGFLRLPDVGLNLANIHLARREFVSAVKMYEHTSQKHFAHKNTQALLYLARAHYDADDLMAAKRALLRATHIAPSDFKLRFNTAFTMQEWAFRVLRRAAPPEEGHEEEPDAKDRTPPTLEEQRQAHLELQAAANIFAHLQAAGRDATGIDPRKIDAHVKFCDTTAQKAAEYIKAAEVAAEEAAALRRRQAADVEMARLAKQQKEALAAAEAERKRAALEAASQLAQQKLQNLREKWKMEGPTVVEEEGAKKKRRGGGGGKRKRGAAAAEEYQEEEPEYQEYPEEAEAEALRLQEEAGMASDEGDGEEEVGSKRKRTPEPARGGRLRKKAAAAAPAVEVVAGEDDVDALFDDGEGAGGGAAADGGDGLEDELMDDVDDGGPTPGSAKKKVGALRDSDDEDLFGDDE